MINYNDGEWHRHCGSVMPDGVHPESIVMVRMLDPGSAWNYGSDYARKWKWGDYGSDTIIAFRVVKEHKEPREFWIYEDIVYTTRPRIPGYIHVREVME